MWATGKRGKHRGIRATFDAVRRRSAMAADGLWASVTKRLRPTRSVPFDGVPRLALICVNFSTTRYLKLMLLTLSEQKDLSSLHRIVIVDNSSRDGGLEFILPLAERAPCIDVLVRRRRLHHAVGMRAGVRQLDKLDRRSVAPANVLLFCDADVIFRDPQALQSLADALRGGAHLVGEWRRSARREGPNIQASFFAVRRDTYARRDIAPLVHDGAPAVRQQASIQRAGLMAVDFPSNHGGFILHRGRAGVEAAALHRPGHAYASVTRNAPHFMRVPNGAAIWQEQEDKHAALLGSGHEAELVELLVGRFEKLS